MADLWSGARFLGFEFSSSDVENRAIFVSMEIGSELADSQEKYNVLQGTSGVSLAVNFLL